VGGIAYNIIAHAIDAAGNISAKPGSTVFNTSYIQVTLKTPNPASVITTPDGSNPHFRSSTVLLQGTATNATTVQVQILDCGADLTCGSGNEDLAWNGGAFGSTTTFNGFVGVTSFVGGAWQMNIPQGAWTTNRNYKISSQAKHIANGTTESTPQTATFVVDDTPPSGTVTSPDSRLYLKSLPTL